MKNLLPLLCAALLCQLALTGCASPSVEASAAKSPLAAQPQLPPLVQGMTAAKIREKLGAPAETKSMESPDGKAEVWIYHYEKTVGTSQVASTTAGVPVLSVGMGPDTMIVQQPVYTMMRKIQVTTLELLMFNDALAAQKSAVTQRLEYD